MAGVYSMGDWSEFEERMGDMADWVNDESPEDDSREDDMSDQQTKGTRIGVAWNPRREGAKALCSGTVTVNGWKQRFSLFKVHDKKADKYPDFELVSWDEPEEDTYAKTRE